MTDRLAIDGGQPVRDVMLPYGRQCVDEEDVQRVVDVLRSPWLTTGPKVGEFEAAFADAVGAREAVVVSNGTAALHLAVCAAGIGAGDQVVTTPLTFVATANAVRFQQGDVVFADVCEESLNIDPAKVESVVGPRTRAIIAVDFAGQPAELDELRDIATRRKLTLIEDAAHALGATYHECPIGSISTLTTFSLHPVKHITAGEGGVVTTDDAALADRMRRLRNHGITRDDKERARRASWHYEIDELGWNYRLSDIHCALGQSQLGKLATWLERRRAIAAQYTREFADLPEVQVPAVCGGRESAWHLYLVRLNLDRLAVDRLQVFRALRAENIGVNVHYIPVPWHPYYRRLGYRAGDWPVAESAYERLLSLPIWPGMSDADVADTVRAMRKVLAAYRLS